MFQNILSFTLLVIALVHLFFMGFIVLGAQNSKDVKWPMQVQTALYFLAALVIRYW